MIILKETGSRSYQLEVDGELIARRRLRVAGGPSGYRVQVSNDGYKLLSDKRWSDFPAGLKRIHIFNIGLNFQDLSIRAEFTFSDKGLRLLFPFSFRATTWKHPWSIKEFSEQCLEIVHAKDIGLLEGEKSWLEEFAEFELLASYDEADPELGQAINQFLPALEDLYASTNDALKAISRNDAMVAYFDFPAEVAVPCEQYLLYFVQFLKDLGVGASADLQHEAGRLLFSVTPESRDVALDRVREALDIFLQLPTNPGIGMAMTPIGDIQAQQLIANVQHLQGQLRLASATIQQQDITIMQRQQTIVDQAFIIERQQKILSGEVLPDALKSVSIQKNSGDRVELFDGAVALTKVEKYGVEVSLAEVFRRVRALLTKRQSTLLLQPPENSTVNEVGTEHIE